MRKGLTFEDGILLCKYIFQSAIEKTLNGVIEQEQIFYRAHKVLLTFGKDFDYERLNEILFLLNMDNIYTII